MSGTAKLGVVTGGFVAAIAAALVAGRAYGAWLDTLPHDTSGGMYAGGVMLASLAAFLALAAPTALVGMWFLRACPRLWNAVAFAAVGFAAAGLLAVLSPLLGSRDSPQTVARLLVDLMSLAQLLAVPLWALAFAVLALLAPTAQSRRKLLVALAVEVAIGGCAAVHWLVPQPPF